MDWDWIINELSQLDFWIDFFIVLSLLVLAAAMRAVQDIIWFYFDSNVIRTFLFRIGLAEWYVGHVSLFQVWFKDECPKWLRYNPSWFFLSDAWHFAKHIEIASYASLFAFAMDNIWAFIALYTGIGGFFTLFYHRVFRGPKIKS